MCVINIYSNNVIIYNVFCRQWPKVYDLCHTFCTLR